MRAPLVLCQLKDAEIAIWISYSFGILAFFSTLWRRTWLIRASWGLTIANFVFRKLTIADSPLILDSSGFGHGPVVSVCVLLVWRSDSNHGFLGYYSRCGNSVSSAWLFSHKERVFSWLKPIRQIDQQLKDSSQETLAPQETQLFPQKLISALISISSTPLKLHLHSFRSGLGNLSRKPESGFEELKSKAA